MKAEVLTLLKERYPDFISGEEISQSLGVSRTAVWKQINKLRQNGYEIESHTKIGYRLVNAPDRLYEQELRGLLNTVLIGRTIVYREIVASTNELAKELAQEGAEEGTVVIAEEQTGGKGRMGRSWYSPAGQGLWFSIILRPKISAVEVSKVTLATAVAVAKAIREVTGLRVGIKWPNDILLDNRKVTGILTEMSAEIERVNYLIVGIGVNVNMGPESIPPDLIGSATSLAEQKGVPVSRIKLLAAVLNNFEFIYGEFVRGNFAAILARWKELSVTLNRQVRITSLHEVDEGIAFDVDDEGALLLKRKDGSVKRVLAGDISLR